MSKRKIKYLELKWIWPKLNKKLNVVFKKKKKNLKIHEKILPGKVRSWSQQFLGAGRAQLETVHKCGY